jgi:hypothetical protein
VHGRSGTVHREEWRKGSTFLQAHWKSMCTHVWFW